MWHTPEIQQRALQVIRHFQELGYVDERGYPIAAAATTAAPTTASTEPPPLREEDRELLDLMERLAEQQPEMDVEHDDEDELEAEAAAEPVLWTSSDVSPSEAAALLHGLAMLPPVPPFPTTATPTTAAATTTRNTWDEIVLELYEMDDTAKALRIRNLVLQLCDELVPTPTTAASSSAAPTTATPTTGTPTTAAPTTATPTTAAPSSSGIKRARG